MHTFRDSSLKKNKVPFNAPINHPHTPNQNCGRIWGGIWKLWKCIGYRCSKQTEYANSHNWPNHCNHLSEEGLWNLVTKATINNYVLETQFASYMNKIAKFFDTFLYRLTLRAIKLSTTVPRVRKMNEPFMLYMSIYK